ncbi:MAG: hypothetical protein FJ000_04420 [Actinobacteria bacterium]|nr:hypothetical protein [Actinomycetota bacterium]
MALPEPDHIAYADLVVGDVAAHRGLRLAAADCSAMGEWLVRYEGSGFVLAVARDRGGLVSIALGSTLRPRPGAQLRGPWSLAHLRGFLGGLPGHYRFAGPQAEADWLRKNEATLFDPALLNGDALREWAVAASRRMFA